MRVDDGEGCRAVTAGPSTPVPARPLCVEPALYAHTPPNGSTTWHLWADHARIVGTLAADFGAAFRAAEICRLLGITHDAGKLTDDVQRALRQRAVDGGRRLGHPHKWEGAALSALLLDAGNVSAAQVMALANFGHHNFIPDRTDPETVQPILRFVDRNRRHLDELVAKMESELSLDLRELAADVTMPEWISTRADLELFTRLCHSTLVDADFLDTAAHFDGSGVPHRSVVRGVEQLRSHFEREYHRRYTPQPGKPASELSGLRWEYFDAGRRAGAASTASTATSGGIYRLPAPTGCGKTLSAAAFALTHAASFGKRRVIVAVPYTSITTQNAAVYRDLLGGLGDDVVLEHHSAILDESVADDGWRRLAAANWDAEFIVTTTVQLLESLFSNRPSATRKLHRLVNSVIVIDEVQSLPLRLVPATLRMMRELSERYGVTFLLASATQPAFWSFDEWRDLPMNDVMPVDYVPAITQRVTYDVRASEQPWEEIADEVSAERQALTIVNTTADAQRLHGLIASRVDVGVPVLHLSTRMYSRHRASVLETARRLLDQKAPVVLVSTQLIEAGVDIDFPVVYRALAPADSVVQSAGRCNREGLLGVGAGRVVVFQPEDARFPAGEYADAARITKSLFIEQAGRKNADDPSRAVFGDPRSMENYYRHLYSLHHDSSAKTVSTDIAQHRKDLAFARTNDAFRLIEDRSTSVVVTDHDDADDAELPAPLIERLRLPGYVMSRADRRLLGAFTATAPSLLRLTQPHLFEQLEGGPLLWRGDYDDHCGLVLDTTSEATIW
ncbi:CRISPR-associated helicase Cas3' [Nocardioides sp. L-11A]|uniref:CRISPR-associated helicase Cas3' n=1 Tax=Nocardioides sp. L-11A TaxID=3043848 RepID=UPI00249C51CA|nr:CRISPR-associated helicase Cas3' [Nocardioides sp. L-11A]